MPPIRKRGPDTSCAVAGLVDTNTLTDLHAEQVVLACLLKSPGDTVPQLRDMKFDKGDLYFDTSQRLYDICMWGYNGGERGPILSSVFEEVRSRRRTRMWLDTFDSMSSFTNYLLDVWATDLWMADIVKWGRMGCPSLPFHAWVAAAAAYKVKHLATRRHAIHAANQLMRDALAPVDGIEGLNRRIEEEW